MLANPIDMNEEKEKKFMYNKCIIYDLDIFNKKLDVTSLLLHE